MTQRALKQREVMRPDQRGFALAAILWLLAGLTILVVSVSGSLLAVSRTNRDTLDRLQLLLAEQRTTADLVYLTQTYRTLGAGVQVGTKVLQLDGSTRYTLEDGTSLVLQDMQGLIGLNSPSTDDLKRLLVVCGAEPQQADALSDALLDYEDSDSLKRLNGAEAFEYSAAGLAPPRDQPLADAQELWQVYGWPKLKNSWVTRQCDRWVSVAPSTMLNLWTAPLPVLRAAGMSEDEATLAVSDRDQGRDRPLLSSYLLTWRSMNEGGGLGGTKFAVRSRGKVRVTLLREGASVSRQFVLDRVSLNHVAPFLRTQLEWIPAPATLASADRDRSSTRFTDNLVSYFLLTPEGANAADAQISTLPIGRP